MALLLMGVRLIRSSQVLASFRRTHVLKLSLPRAAPHAFSKSFNSHSQAKHSSSSWNTKGWQGLDFCNFLSQGGIAMTPEKG